MSNESKPRARAYSQLNFTQLLPFCEKRVTRSTTRNLLLGKDEITETAEESKMGDPETQSEVVEDGQQTPPLNPDDITPATWLKMFNTLNNTLSSLQVEIQDIKTVKTQVSEVTNEWKRSVDTEMDTKDEII